MGLCRAIVHTKTYFSSHKEMRKLDKTGTLVTIGDMTYVREETKTDFYNCMCLYFQSDSICACSEFV